jgi:hypothetical protein
MTALAKSNLRNFALLWASKWCMCVCVCVRECAGAWSTVSSYMHKDPRSVQDACYIKIDVQKLFAPLCIEGGCFAPQQTFSHLAPLSFSPSLTLAYKFGESSTSQSVFISIPFLLTDFLCDLPTARLPSPSLHARLPVYRIAAQQEWEQRFSTENKGILEIRYYVCVIFIYVPHMFPSILTSA